MVYFTSLSTKILRSCFQTDSFENYSNVVKIKAYYNFIKICKKVVKNKIC